MRNNQKFNGIVEMEDIKITADKGSVVIPVFTGEDIPNFDSGDSLPQVLSKQQNINANLGDLAYKDESELGLDNYALITQLPTLTSELTNDSGFGRPVLMQKYNNVDFNGVTKLTLPDDPARTATDIFKIVGLCSDGSLNYFIQGTFFVPFSETSYLYFCTISKDDGSLTFSAADNTIKLLSLDDELDLSGFGISGGIGDLRIYYK